jgi:hypothetical protein
LQHFPGEESAESAERDTVANADQTDKRLMIKMSQAGKKKKNERKGFKTHDNQRDHMNTLQALPVNIPLDFLIDGREYISDAFLYQFHKRLNSGQML